MLHEAIPIDRPGLLDAICDALCMTLWEFLRRRKAASVAEMAGVCGVPITTAMTAIDLLSKAGLVAARPAGRGRKTVTYAVTSPEIRVDNSALPPAQVDALVERWEAVQTDIFRQLTRRSAQPRGAAQKRGFGMDWAYITDDEGRRITALLRELFGIIFAAKDRHAQTDPDGACTRPPQNAWPYALLFQIAPVTGPARPMASVMFSRQPAERANRLRDEGAKRAELSPRERQVAEALVAGMTRPEVAGKLGVSPYTVVSLTQRIYAKLKVRSRAELARVMTSRL
jgi:DNA-binding CsgD family transcriptional regulator